MVEITDKNDIKLYTLLFLILFSTTGILILGNLLLNKSNYSKIKADDFKLSPTPGKSCNVRTDSVTSGCDFYENCINNFCQFNSGWSESLTPTQAAAIYQRLKSDLGIDIPLILDKERVDKLQDAGIVAASNNNPCQYAVMFDTTGIGALNCFTLREDNPEYKRLTDVTTLHGILQATYPDLSSQEISNLENKLRAVVKEKAPGAALETATFTFDLLSLPFLVKDVGTLGIKTLSKGGEILPKLLGLVKSSGSFYFDKEGITSLLSLAESNGYKVLDFATQMKGYLKTVQPYKKITLGKKFFIFPNKIALWRSRQVLTSDTWNLFSNGITIAFQRLGARLAMPIESQSIYFIDDIARIVGPTRNAIGVYLSSIDGFVLDIKTIQWGVKQMVEVSIHEKIHQILSRKGISQYIASLAQKGQFWNYRAFEEGVTQYLTEYIMREMGYDIQIGKSAYAQQVLAVQKFLGDGKYTEILIRSIQEGNFRYLLDQYHWDINALQRWIISNVRPISKNEHDVILNIINSPVEAVSFEPSSYYYTGNYEENLISHSPFSFPNNVDVTPLNLSAYTLIDELNRIVNENNLQLVSLDEDSLKLLLLSGEFINNINSNKTVSLDHINGQIDILNDIQVVEDNGQYEYNSILPQIGNDNMPIPSDIP